MASSGGAPIVGKAPAAPRAPAKPSKPIPVKAHTRAAPTPRPQRAAPMNPLLDPNQTLSGRSLAQAADALSNVQTAGPLAELQKQIAANNAQTRGTINLTGGFYNQLEPYVQQGVGQQGQIASGLNTQLQNIGSDTQTQLQGIGQNAMSSLLKYAPQGEGGIANAATSDLAAQIARQQGLAAQQSGTYRAFGANQGANYQGLASSQLGTFGLQGQEALKGIAQSGTVKNEPLVQKIADLRAQQGALTATNLGKLRQQEIENRIATTGLGIKTQANQIAQARVGATIRGQNITAANDAATQALAGRRLDVTTQNNLANQTLGVARLNEKTNNDAANRALRQAGLNLRAAQGAGGAVKPLTPSENNQMYRLLGQAQQLITDGQGKKLSEQQIRANLADGANPSKRAFDPVLIQAAYELKGWGYITPATARAMRGMGMRSGARPIQVKARANPNAPVGGQGGGPAGIGG